MRLLHFHSFRKNCFVLLVFLSEPFAIDKQSPYQGDTKDDEYDTIDTVDDMNIMRREPVPDLTCQENLQYIRSQHPDKTGAKDNDAVVHRMIQYRRGSSDPEDQHGRVQGIHEIAG